MVYVNGNLVNRDDDRSKGNRTGAQFGSDSSTSCGLNFSTAFKRKSELNKDGENGGSKDGDDDDVVVLMILAMTMIKIL